MRFNGNVDTSIAGGMCSICGIPLDAEYFDASSVVPMPGPGGDVVLARFELPPQYCGLLNYFSQFTDLYGKDNSQIETPGLEWLLLMNNRPLFPYLNLDRIVNPWGYCSFPVNLRLDDSATIEFVVRNIGGGTAANGETIKRVGGRIMGRYWYNTIYGDMARRGR
jgi:hypothetical protein